MPVTIARIRELTAGVSRGFASVDTRFFRSLQGAAASGGRSRGSIPGLRFARFSKHFSLQTAAAIAEVYAKLRLARLLERYPTCLIRAFSLLKARGCLLRKHFLPESSKLGQDGHT